MSIKIKFETMNKDLVDTIMKKDLEEVFRNTHKQMLEKHPEQKETIDEMLVNKLKSIGIKDD